MRIDAVELSVLRLPLVRPFETSFGRMAAREFVLVAARHDGVAGWGECVAEVDPYYSSETTASSWQILSKYLVPAVLGIEIEHPRGLHGLWRRVRGHRMAKAALAGDSVTLGTGDSAVGHAAVLPVGRSWGRNTNPPYFVEA